MSHHIDIIDKISKFKDKPFSAFNFFHGQVTDGQKAQLLNLMTSCHGLALEAAVFCCSGQEVQRLFSH